MYLVLHYLINQANVQQMENIVLIEDHVHKHKVKKDVQKITMIISAIGLFQLFQLNHLIV